MNLHLEKCMRIISELVAFCHFEGAEEFQISIKHDKAGRASAITVSCPVPELSPETISEFAEELNLPRQREVEQDYWELGGESDMSGEMSLVGMMIDTAQVSYQDGVLYISISRKD